MNKPTGNDDQEYNEPFDQWLRAMKPPFPDSQKEREESRNLFRKNMVAMRIARKKRRLHNLKRGSVVMMLVVVSVFAFNLSELGSDGFDMVEVEDALTPGGVVKNEFRGDGFNVVQGETEQEIRETNQQISTDDGIIIEAEGWLLNGNVFWLIKREYTINGTEKVNSRATKDPHSISSQELAAFLSSDDWSNLYHAIQVGDAPSGGEKELELDGVWFSVQFWSFSLNNFDEGYYYWGEPIR